jgi:hypothetical protein
MRSNAGLQILFKYLSCYRRQSLSLDQPGIYINYALSQPDQFRLDNNSRELSWSAQHFLRVCLQQSQELSWFASAAYSDG